MATLYIVSTPIGNLKDVTLRAIDTLKLVDYIFAEDTRVTRTLLVKYGIKAKVLRHDDNNARVSTKGVVKLLDEGNNVALVSDSGTPCISDPGYVLVSVLREGSKHKIVSIPGASAVTSALSICGLPPIPYIFVGFIGKKNYKKIDQAIDTGYTVVFFESPKRIQASIKYIADKYPGATVCICRELTKKFEQVECGNIQKVSTMFGTEIKVKGEFTVILSTSPKCKNVS